MSTSGAPGLATASSSESLHLRKDSVKLPDVGTATPRKKLGSPATPTSAAKKGKVIAKKIRTKIPVTVLPSQPVVLPTAYNEPNFAVSPAPLAEPFTQSKTLKDLTGKGVFRDSGFYWSLDTVFTLCIESNPPLPPSLAAVTQDWKRIPEIYPDAATTVCLHAASSRDLDVTVASLHCPRRGE